MRTGRPLPPVTITNEERETLERWARRPTTGQAVAQRARLILSCATGRTNTRVAHDLLLTKQTVGKWRTRFLAKGLDGLLDEPRPGAPRTVSDADVERVLTRTLETKPADATHWSIRSMAQVCGLSRSTVNRIWHAFALQPHRTETFKLSKDPLFIEKVRDIVGLYLNPPDRALVCVSMRRVKFRRWIGPNRCCRCAPARWSGAPTTMSATAPHRCSLPWTPRAGRSSASCIGAIGPASSENSSTPSPPPCPLSWTCT
jgi:transposase